MVLIPAKITKFLIFVRTWDRIMPIHFGEASKISSKSLSVGWYVGVHLHTVLHMLCCCISFTPSTHATQCILPLFPSLSVGLLTNSHTVCQERCTQAPYRRFYHQCHDRMVAVGGLATPSPVGGGIVSNALHNRHHYNIHPPA